MSEVAGSAGKHQERSFWGAEISFALILVMATGCMHLPQFTELHI
jgi:hypothetical protein